MHWDKYTRRSSDVDARVLPGHSSLLCSVACHVLRGLPLPGRVDDDDWFLTCFCGDVCVEIPNNWFLMTAVSVIALGEWHALMNGDPDAVGEL